MGAKCKNYKFAPIAPHGVRKKHLTWLLNGGGAWLAEEDKK